MTTTKKNAEKNTVKKLKYSNKKLEFCPYCDTGGDHFDPAGDRSGGQRLRKDQPQNSGGGCGRLHQSGSSRQE